jgi:CubicO group peptidase (beta-lactamase class C family)
LDPFIVAGDSPISMYDFLKNYLVPGGTYYTNDSYNSYPPVSTWNYCNVATGLLGYLVEAITDTSFDEYCQQHIFAPLQMNETAWFLASLDTSHIARPYMWTTAGYEPFPHQGIPLYPAGWLRSSSLQLAHFLNAFMQKGKLGDIKILDSSTVELITTAHYPEIPLNPFPDSSQGLIWYWEYFGNRVAWGHEGGIYGATTRMFYCDPEKSGVIVLTNGDPAQAWWGVKNITIALFDYADSMATGIARRYENVADDFTLSQNYPNPFNPSTTIDFALPHASVVTLTIYNTLGQLVETLISERLSAGRFEASWDAGRYSSGIYFYRLQAESPSTSVGHRFEETRKMILMK